MNNDPINKIANSHPNNVNTPGQKGNGSNRTLADSTRVSPTAFWHHWSDALALLVRRMSDELNGAKKAANSTMPRSAINLELDEPPKSPNDDQADTWTGRAEGKNVRSFDQCLEMTERKSVNGVGNEQHEFVQALHDAAINLNGSLDIERTLDRILMTIARVVPYDSANLMLFESGSARIVRSKGLDANQVDRAAVNRQWVVDLIPQLREVIATGQAITITDTTERPGEIEFLGASWVRSHITAPIQIGKQIIGFLNVDSSVRGMFNPTHAFYLQAFADQGAMAIENARLIAESQHRIRELSALNRIQSSINSTLELEWVLRLTMQEVQDLFAVEECSLMLLDEQANEFSFQVGLGPHTSKKFQLDINRGIAGWVARTGNPALVNDVHADTRWDPGPDSATGFRTRCLLVVPLKSRNKTIGVVELINKIDGNFADSDLRLLNSVSNLVAGAIENARLFGELNKAYQDMARTQVQVIASRNTLRTLFDGIDDRICIVNSDLRVQALNRAASAEMGLDPRHGIGKHCYEILNQADQPCERCPARETLRTGKSALSTQGRTKKNGEPQEFEARTYPLENSDGMVESIIEIVQDVTEKRKMESTIVQSAKLSAVGELAAGVAHEINNPLTAVYGNAQMLLETLQPGDPRVEMVQLIERAGLRASKVVRNLLDFSRQEDYQFEAIDINSNIEDALALILHQLQRSQITVTRDHQLDLPLVQASPSHLQMVWTNLLLNAKDAIGEKKAGRIKITTRMSENGQMIQALFIDDGPGIADKDLPRVFDPFYTTKPQGRGTGLGLYVSQLIVAYHSGTIQVQSEWGKGATFIVNLPWVPIVI